MKKIISWARSGILFLILFAFVCAMLISSQAFSAERSIARLTDFSGTVLIKSQGSWGVEPEEGLPLYSDDKIVTKIGIATVTFNDGAVIEINPNSNLLIEESEEEETGIGEKISGLKRRLRLFLGKMSFRTARGSDTKTSLATSTMVCGLRGTAGTLSIGADGQTYLQFTEGGGDTIGDFISGVAADVPTELANLSPAQRAAFVAAAAAEQAKQAQEKLASGEITDADAVYAAAQAAEAAAQEAKAAAEAMMNNPDPDIQAEAAAAIAAADAAIAASQEAQEQAVESGATPGAAPPQEGEAEIGFDVEVTDYSKGDLLEEDDRRMADTYPPVILLSLKPQTITHLSEALFEFSIDDNTSDIDKILVSYKLDGGDVVELEPPDEETLEEFGDEPYFYTIDFSGLSEKPHQLIIIAVDEENNTATKSYTWTTDYTAPVALIPTKPADIANTSSFGFDATDTNKSAGITYQYSLDGGAWTSTPAALNLSLAATEGTPYTISVKATDAAGNTGAAVSYTWTYDTIGPVASIPTTPAAIANTSSFGFDATDANKSAGITYQYSLDGGATWTATDPALALTLPATTGTSYTVSVKATDVAGNIGEAVSYTWIYDTIGPVASIPTKPATIANTSSFGLDATDTNKSAGITYQYSLDGGAWTSTAASLNLALATDGSKDGSRTISVKATDAAGNTGSAVSYTWTYDTIAPVAMFTSTPEAIDNTSAFELSATDTNASAGITYQYSIDGGATWTAADPALALTLADTTGTAYTIQVKSTDAAGNTSTAASYAWTYDSIPPTLGPLSASYDGVGATIDASYTSYEPGTVGYVFDGPDTGLLDGEYTLTVTATDQAGNSSTSDPLTFTLDVSNLEGSIFGTGSVITGYGYGGAVAVLGENWGGWETDMAGNWTDSHTGSLSLVSGGSSTTGYWLSLIDGSIDTNGDATGSSDFTLLTQTSLTKGSGSFTGSFGVGTSGTWTGTETGSGLVDTPLAFGGSWGGASIYDNVEGDLYGIGGEGGYFGILTAPADGPAEFLALGEYGGEFGYPENNEVYLLNSEIFSDEILDGGGYGGGIADGYAGGFLERAAVSGEGTFDGNIALVWYDSNGNAGLLTDDNAWGIFYPEIWMWEAQGTLNSDVRETGLNPSNISNMNGYLGAMLMGSFDGGVGGIYGEVPCCPDGYTTFLYDYMEYTDLPFGVYDLKLGYGNYYYDKPADDPTWSGMIGGEGIFGYNYYGPDNGIWLAEVVSNWSAESVNGDGTIYGTLSGDYLTYTHKGVINGPFYGLYDAYSDGYGGYLNDGTWIGKSVGTYEGELLAWSEEGYGFLYYNDYGYLGYGGYIGGLAGGVNFPPTDFFAMGYGEGGYGGYGGSLLWNFYSMGGPVTGYGGYGGGYVIDVSGGFARDPEGSAMYGDLEGDIFGIYLSAAGYGGATAGLFSGPASGQHYPDPSSGNSVWRMYGSLTSRQLASGLNPYSIEPQDGQIYGYLSGNFDGPGGIWGETFYPLPGETVFFTDYSTGSSLPFGIYDMMLGWDNYYYNPYEPTTWSGIIGGGETAFGYRYYPEGYWDYEYGYWLATVTNGMWAPGGELTGDVGAVPGTETSDMFGYYITPYQMGNIWGELYGVNDTMYGGYGGGWIAKSIGQFEGEPLAWSEYGYGGVFFNDDGWIGYGGSIEGLAGGVDDFPPSDFFAMGESYGGYGGYGGSGLWNFISYGGPVTEPGYGGYGGIIDVSGGFARQPVDGATYGILKGDLVGIYLTETGDAGFFTGALSGYNYFIGESNTLWTLEGDLTSEDPKVTGLDPYFIEFENGFITANMIGDFSGEGWIIGEDYYMSPMGQTWFLYDWEEETSLPWGIYDVVLGDSNYYYNPFGSTEWSGIMGGNGVFGYGGSYGYEFGMWLASVSGEWDPDAEFGEFTGEVGAAPGQESEGIIFGYYITNFHRGNIWGDLYGLNNTYGYGGYDGGWIAKSIGRFEGEPLDFGGDSNWSLLYNDSGDINWSGYWPPSGLFGLTQRDDGDYDLLTIGEYWEEGYGEGGYGGPYVWSGSLYGYQVVDGGYGGYGGVVGFTAGSWQKDDPGATSGSMDGHAAVIYYTEAGEVGLLSGNILGDFYEMNEYGYGGMFLTDGILTETLLDPPDGYDPSTAGVSSNSLYADLAGSFGESGTNTIFGTYYSYSDNRTKFITYYDYTDFSSKSLPFGIYNLKLGDGYDYNYYWDKPADIGDGIAWSAKVGGYGGFGYNEEDYGYWLADIGNTWDEIAPYDGYGGYDGYGTIDGSLEGKYLTSTHMGTISGPFYGLYTEYGFEPGYGGYGSWMGVSVGTYVADAALDFGGEWYHSLLYDDEGWIEWASGGAHDQEYDDIPYPEGLFGLVQLTEDSYDLLAIGDFTDLGYGGGGYGGPYVWSGSFYGDEIIDGEYGYGGADGFTAGSWKKVYTEDSSGSMNGYAAVIYYTEAGEVGLLSGNVEGDFYEQYYDGYDWYSGLGYGGGMFLTKGVLTATAMGTPDGYDPYTADIDDNSLYADLAGSFAGNDGNTIFGTYYNGKTKFITYDDSTDGYSTKSLPFGIYNLKLGDGYYSNYYEDKPADMGDGVAWSAKVGGSGYFGYNNDGDDYGYWLADINSVWDETAPYDGYGGYYGYGTIDGDLDGTYLTGTRKGTISGPFYGLYTEYGIDPGYGGYGGWIGVSVGTYYEHEEDLPLDFGGGWGATSLYLYDSIIGLIPVGNDNGRFGLTKNLDGDYDLLAIGEYQDYGFMGGYGGPYVWNSPINGDEVSSLGGYGGLGGFTGGSWNSSSSPLMMNGYAAAIAASDNGDGTVDAMLLYGPVSGDIFEMDEYGYGGMWMAEGTLNSVVMEEGITISGDDPVETGDVNFFGYGGGFIDVNSDPIAGSSINVYASQGQSINLIGYDWGAWSSILGGTYDDVDSGSTDWYLSLHNGLPDINRWAEVIGNEFTDGEIAADVAGAWVNILDATTGVMGGGLSGTFDPLASTWQAMGVGTYMDTTTFLSMANPGNTAGNEALEALNIPYIEVGRTNLSGSGGNLTLVNMNDVTFFAYSDGASPRIWATGDVQGVTNGSDPTIEGFNTATLGDDVNFIDSVNFIMNNYGAATEAWDASVNGSGTVGGQPIDMEGGAAGTVDSTTTFSGTGAGVARPSVP